MQRSVVLLFLHCHRKTGQRRTTPVLYLQDGTGLIVIASFGGNDMHPAWYLNLVAHSEATVQVGRATREVKAREATEEERSRLATRFWSVVLKNE